LALGSLLGSINETDKLEKMIYPRFYSELGKLLYAVASADGVISEKETLALHKMVKDELVPSEKHLDKYGTDAAYYTEIEFEILKETPSSDSEAAFNSFIDFVEKHQSAFDARLKRIALHIAEELAEAYRGTNKKEKALIDKLKHCLENMNPDAENG
jgi:uncharacterized tellurite resistance protein B-like protein